MGLGGPRRPGVGGASWGAPLRPCSGLRRGPRLRPAGPCSPLRGLRSGLGGMRRGPVVPPIRAGRPALFAGPSGPWRGLRAPGALLGPLRLSRPRAARRGVPPAPCGGRRRLVPAPPPPRGPSRARPGRWRRGPPLGGLAWCLPWLGAAPCSPPGGGVGPLAPPPGGRHCWPLLLAPEDLERRRRTASRRSVSMSAMA